MLGLVHCRYPQSDSLATTSLRSSRPPPLGSGGKTRCPVACHGLPFLGDVCVCTCVHVSIVYVCVPYCTVCAVFTQRIQGTSDCKRWLPPVYHFRYALYARCSFAYSSVRIKPDKLTVCLQSVVGIIRRVSYHTIACHPHVNQKERNQVN